MKGNIEMMRTLLRCIKPQPYWTRSNIKGWVYRRRGFRWLSFIDMRDRDGVVQVCFDPNTGS